MSLKDDVLDMKDEIKDIKKESFAYELLQDQRKQNKRLFIILILVLVMWFATGVYLVYILNDTGTIEEVTTKSQEISDVNNIDNSNIVNGDMNGKSKADN